MEANLIPFDLELHQTGKYNVVTREGIPVKILAILPFNYYPIVGRKEGLKMSLSWTRQGLWFCDLRTNNDIFLQEKDENKQGYSLTRKGGQPWKLI